jgi:hypothetical protein
MSDLTVMLPQMGTGNRRPARVFTDGKLRWEFEARSGALQAMGGLSEPTTAALTPLFFFRQSGTRWQACALFPSGATQILATEP